MFKRLAAPRVNFFFHYQRQKKKNADLVDGALLHANLGERNTLVLTLVREKLARGAALSYCLLRASG
jgi:hypothetical protein